ncbi:MAG: cation transporter [Clostridia bacterium]|nr:cation transporter [Clostridia bacterium]
MGRNKIIIRTSIKGIIVNLALVAFKAAVGFFANSIAIILDAVNNLTDAFSSIITIVGAKLSGRAPDKKHPYGHGRTEYITAVIIAEIVLLAGVIAGKESLDKIIHPVKPEYSPVSLVIIGVAVLVKFFFGRYVKNVGKKVKSGNLIASGQDAFMDSVLSFTTLVAALINFFTGLALEGWLGLIIAVFIVKAAIEMLMETFTTMVGVRADKEFSDKIKESIASFEGVQGPYDLNLHSYGPEKTVASANIQVPNAMTAEEIHILTRNIEYAVFAQYGIVLTLGIYAANDEGEFGEMKRALEEILKDYKTVLQMHGFYVEKAKNNCYFDLIIDFDEKDKEGIKNEIVAKMKEKYSAYNYYVILDSDITD